MHTRMMITALLLLTGVAPAWGQPRIGFPDSPWDFGEVLQQQQVSHRFEVQNEGTDTLFISRVKPSCGCTSAPLTRDVIGPGESIWLDITFSTKKFSGDVSKKVLVFSNDPNNPQAELVFTARVETGRKHVVPASEPVDLGHLVPDQGGQSEITLTNISSEPYRLRLADWPRSWFAPDWTERVVDPGNSLALPVGTNGVPPLGQFTASITFELEGREKSRLSLPIQGVGLVE